MTNQTFPLVGRELVKAANEFFADVPELDAETHEQFCLAFYELAGYTDEEEARAEIVKAIEEVQADEALTDECLKSFNRDLQLFCAVGYAPVKMGFMETFEGIQPWGLLQLDNAQEQWVAAYKRLVRTEHGLTVITQTRAVVCNWFAKWGSTDAGDFETRRNHLFEEWDAWEKEAGGVNGDGIELAKDWVKANKPDTFGYQLKLGLVLSMVMATDAWLEDNKGDEEALAKWPIVQKAYDGDVAWASSALKVINGPDIAPPFFDALLETFIPLISQAASFRNLTGLWAVKRLEELLNLEATEEPVAQTN